MLCRVRACSGAVHVAVRAWTHVRAVALACVFACACIWQMCVCVLGTCGLHMGVNVCGPVTKVTVITTPPELVP